MKTGLKSILFGYHAFWLHPFFVAWAWVKIYGFPWDPRLWAAFFVHDLGYYKCEHMDDAKGERHPEFGAHLMFWLFDWELEPPPRPPADYVGAVWEYEPKMVSRWSNFCLYHSRTYAARDGRPISRLAYADKLAFLLYGQWLLKILYTLSGEFEEYRRHCYGVENDKCEPLPWDEWYRQASEANKKTLKEINYVG
jgi:hypothetical protein